MNISKNRIAIFMPGLYDGGAERIILNLAAGLCQRGHEIDLVLAQSEGPFLDQIPEQVRVIKLKKRNIKVFRTLASLPGLANYLKSEKPDALLSVLYANIVAVWARRLAGNPKWLVISEHNTFSRRNLSTPKWYSWIMPRLVKRFYPWANSIVAVSEGVADDLARAMGTSRRHIQVIYNPIVTPELQVKSKIPLEHPWFKPGEPPVILAVGRLTDQKDFPMLIQAFAQVRKNHRIRLLILGEGEERPALEKLARQLGVDQDISMPGFVMNPYNYMANAGMFILSSKWEGLPTVLVEALYCGVPLIATDCPSGPREILKNGKYGKLVPVGDTLALANAIETSLNSPASPLPMDSWTPFELENVVNQYESLLLGNV